MRRIVALTTLLTANVLIAGGGTSEANGIIVSGVVAPTVGVILDRSGSMLDTSGTSEFSVTQTRLGNTVTTTVVPR